MPRRSYCPLLSTVRNDSSNRLLMLSSRVPGLLTFGSAKLIFWPTRRNEGRNFSTSLIPGGLHSPNSPSLDVCLQSTFLRAARQPVLGLNLETFRYLGAVVKVDEEPVAFGVRCVSVTGGRHECSQESPIL